MFASFLRRELSFTKDVVWSKVLLFCLTLFLIRVADAMISFWAPVQIQSAFGDPFVMGLIISFQSVIGFSSDLIFPKLLKTTKARRLIFLAILMSALASLLLVTSIYRPFIAIFLITMTFWGIYYELVGFASYQFMGSTVPIAMRSGAWAISGIFVNLAYFLGPLIATFMLLRGPGATELVILALLFVSLIILVVTKKAHEGPTKVDLTEINPWIELKHWFSLSKHIWPMIIMSMLIGFIDSTFWTTGAVLTEKLSGTDPLGGLFLPLYQFPSIFLGVMIAKWGIYKGKKKLSEKILIVTGIFIAGLGISGAIVWQLSMVLLSGIAMAICYPLVEGVYTDIIARMGKEKKEMIGLISSVVNVSYVVWPPIAGFVAGVIGERLTFSFVGALTVVVAFVLLFVTPKKLRLPQTEIKTWE